MGTRADFYVGRGPSADWLGSIGYDGYPDGEPRMLEGVRTEVEYRKMVDFILRGAAASGTRPEQGWPWPWTNSATSDFAYAFERLHDLEEGAVWISQFGGEWRLYPDSTREGVADPGFPDMSSRQSVADDRRSGLLILRGPKG